MQLSSMLVIVKKQLLFLNEMMRVGRNLFLTTPNKYFPIDSHTNAFLRHWFDDHFYDWCAERHPVWTRDTLVLFGYNDLKRMLARVDHGSFVIQKNRLLGWPMTFTIICVENNENTMG